MNNCNEQLLDFNNKEYFIKIRFEYFNIIKKDKFVITHSYTELFCNFFD